MGSTLLDSGEQTVPDVHFRSKPEKLNESKCFPLFTQQRTSPRYFGMSVSCQQETRAPQQTARYSITSSAVVRMSGGTVRASVLAVLRLMTSSYFVGA